MGEMGEKPGGGEGEVGDGDTWGGGGEEMGMFEGLFSMIEKYIFIISELGGEREKGKKLERFSLIFEYLEVLSRGG